MLLQDIYANEQIGSEKDTDLTNIKTAQDFSIMDGITGGGGGWSSGSSSGSSSSNSSTNNNSTQKFIIPTSHPLYPGIIGTHNMCPICNHVDINIIDAKKLSGEGAKIFNNASYWYPYKSNTIYNKIYPSIASTPHSHIFSTSVGFKPKGNTSWNSIANNKYYLVYTSDNIFFYKKVGDVADETEKKEPEEPSSNNNENTVGIVTNKPDDNPVDPQVNTEDLLNKGKLVFETTTIVSYSYSYILTNIIPNPLYNEIINDKYNDNLYATGDLNGIDNTTYLKYNKNNIVNNISNNYYLPSIGELGISMQNIQIINDSIDALGEEYNDCKIPYNAIIASSSLYYSNNIENDNYRITNNINNVWCFDNTSAEITYKPISNKFTIIPFYKFDNNIVINLDEDIEDVDTNSIVTIQINKIDQSERYIETNQPIHNFKLTDLSDFNTTNWFEHPFNSKYFFNILFPEIIEFIEKDNNLLKLHNDYLSYYIYSYYNYYNQGEEYMKCLLSTSQPAYSYFDIENSLYCQRNVHSNNGVLLPSYAEINGSSYIIKTKTDDSWKQYLIYNTCIYDNHIILMPKYGSGESNLNFKKNKTKAEIYVTIPSSCSEFNCVMNNTTDCVINIIKEFSNINNFDIYWVEFVFNEHIPTDNVLIFSCKYQNKKITKKYYYSIYSLTLSGLYWSPIYFSIDNFYVARDPFNWWKTGKWDTLYSNWTQNQHVDCSYYIINNKPVSYAGAYTYTYYDGFGKLYDQTYNQTNIKLTLFKNNNYTYTTVENYRQTTYLYPKYYNNFTKLSYSYFYLMYDMSYMINNIGTGISNNINGIEDNAGGLRVDRLIDNDVTNIILSYNYNESNYSYYSYFMQSIFKPQHNYHLFTINSYYYDPSKPLTMLYHNVHNTLTNMPIPEERQYYKPVIRINRTTDMFGIYNDLIFMDVSTDIKNSYTIKLKNNTPFNGDNNAGYKINGKEEFEYSYNDPYQSSNTLVWNNNIHFAIDHDDHSNVGTSYLNKFSLNIPIVGAKQSICLALDMPYYVSQEIFKGEEDLFYYYNYVFSDYLFLFNNTNTIIELLISDPSLSIINKQQVIIQLQPKELKLYYPSNFNYNAKLKTDNINIYTIKIVNKSSNSSNQQFSHYYLGEYNQSFDDIVGNKGNIKDQIGYKLITNLMYYYYQYTHNNISLTSNILLTYLISTINSIKKDQTFNNIELRLFPYSVSVKTNNIDINIKNYSENKAGHMVIIHDLLTRPTVDITLDNSENQSSNTEDDSTNNQGNHTPGIPDDSIINNPEILTPGTPDDSIINNPGNHTPGTPDDSIINNPEILTPSTFDDSILNYQGNQTSQILTIETE